MESTLTAKTSAPSSWKAGYLTATAAISVGQTAEKNTIGGSHGFEGSEITQVFESEVIKRLTCDGGADEKSQCYGNAEIDGNARVFHIIVIGNIFEFLRCIRRQSGACFNPFTQDLQIFFRPCFNQNEREEFSLPGSKDSRPTVSCIYNGLGLEGSRHFADTHNHGTVVIDLQSVADLERDGLAASFLGPFGQPGPGPDVIDNNSILPAKVRHLPDFRRTSIL